MNPQPSSKKPIIIVIIVVVLAALAYFYYSGSSPAPSATLDASGSASSDAIGAQVLSISNQISSLNIDASLFKDPAYVSLRDYSVQIPPVDVGRTNPFAPIPGFSIAAPPAAGH